MVTTYDRSAWIWATLRQFFETLAIELGRAHRRHAAVSEERADRRSGRSRSCCSARCSPRCRSSASGQTINLFSLAGLAIAIGEIADATIVIVENCTAELSMHGAMPAPPRSSEIVIRSIASVAKPLLFSLLIILASFLPVFFLEEREARLFDPLAYSKTFAMAFSTLLTLLLLPLIVVWIFKRDTIARRNFQESAPSRGIAPR